MSREHRSGFDEVTGRNAAARRRSSDAAPRPPSERGLYEELLVTLIDAFTSSAAWLAERIGCAATWPG